MGLTSIELDQALWFRDDALGMGLTDSDIQRRIRTGEWARVRWGAYCPGKVWNEIDAHQKHRLRSRAVLHRGHPDNVLSHVSAALEYGAPVWGVDLEAVHLTRLDARGGRCEAGVVHHRGMLRADEVVEVSGQPATGPARVAVELATIAPLESALVTTNALLHDGHMSVADLAAMVERATHWPNSLTADLVLRLADPRIESPAESRFFFLAWEQRLPKPIPQCEVYDEVGRIVARADFALPELSCFFEIDGREKYFKYRRAGESLEDFILREKQRQELITLLTGWTCIRITWDDLNNPRRTAHRIRGVIDALATSRTSLANSSLRG